MSRRALAALTPGVVVNMSSVYEMGGNGMALQSLENRHILILGGSDGMGLATAAYLLHSGSIVTISARRPGRLEEARQELLTETGTRADQLRSIPADAGDATAVEAAVAQAVNEEGALHGVFVVAGAGPSAPVLDNRPESVVEQYAWTIVPTVNAINAAAPLMMKGGGSIVVLSSTAAIRSYPGLSSYSASKAGLEQYVRVAADELGEYQIRVNAVRPGLTRNGRNGPRLDADATYVSRFGALTPLGDYGLSEDFGPMVSLLLSDETRWITGQTFSIDGGLSLRGYGGGILPSKDPVATNR